MATKKQKAEDRKRAGVRGWYATNRVDYNAKRRERYAANAEARERAQERARTYRDRTRGHPADKTYQRQHNGKTITVYTAGTAAGMIGGTSQMIRNWETQGLIPPSIFADSHRLYTKNQIELMKYLSEVLKQYRYDRKNRAKAMTSVATRISRKWNA